MRDCQMGRCRATKFGKEFRGRFKVKEYGCILFKTPRIKIRNILGKKSQNTYTT